MTLTHRATPSCLPEAPRPEIPPTFSDALARMKELARNENRAANFGQASISRKKGGKADTLGRKIFEYVRDNPRAYTSHLVADLGKSPRTVYNSIQAARAIAHEEGYEWKVEDHRVHGKNARLYWLEPRP